MAPVEFWSLNMAGRLLVQAPGVEAWPAAASAAAADGWMGRLILNSGSPDAAYVQVRLTDGMSFHEEYEYRDGTLRLASGGLYDPVDFRYYGDQHAFVWESGTVAVWASTAEHPLRWLTDYVGFMEFGSGSHSATVIPKDPADWSHSYLQPDGLHLVVSIPGVGPMKLLDPGRADALVRHSARSMDVEVGTVHRFQGRGAPRLLLVTRSAAFAITTLETNADGAVERLADVGTLEWLSNN